MVFLKRGENSYEIHFGGKKFLASFDGAVLSIRPERLENDATATLHDLAMALNGYAGCGIEVTLLRYPREARMRFDGPESFRRMQEAVSASLRDFIAGCDGPLQALLLTLYSCGESRTSLAARCDLSQARISMMTSDPGCCTTSRPMFRLRNYVAKKYEPLLPLAEAAEAFSRSKLGEFFVRGGKNRD